MHQYPYRQILASCLYLRLKQHPNFFFFLNCNCTLSFTDHLLGYLNFIRKNMLINSYMKAPLLNIFQWIQWPPIKWEWSFAGVATENYIILQLYGVFQPLSTFAIWFSLSDESTNLVSSSRQMLRSSDKPNAHTTCRAPNSRRTQLVTSWWRKMEHEEPNIFLRIENHIEKKSEYWI